LLTTEGGRVRERIQRKTKGLGRSGRVAYPGEKKKIARLMANAREINSHQKRKKIHGEAGWVSWSP